MMDKVQEGITSLPHMILVLATVALVGVLAEPPVGNQYLPPNGGYSGAPSPTYGAPGGSSRFGGSRSASLLPRGRLDSRGGMSAVYGAPSATGRFGASPASVYGAPGYGAPSTQYGAPAFAGNGRFGGALISSSTQYGAPGYGGNEGFSSVSSPSTQYGAPGFSGPVGPGSSPSTLYGATRFAGNGGYGGALSSPSTQYGAPGFSGNGGFGGALGAPSAQYGAPGLGGNGGFGVPSGTYRVPATRYASPNGGGFGGSSYASAAAGRFRTPGPAPVYGAPYAETSRGTTEDPLAVPANYEFSYEVQDQDSGNDFGHRESRQNEDAVGEYRVTLPDGRTQVVEYEANEAGYNPSIRYEETAEGAAAAQRSAENRSAAQGGYSYGRGQGGPY